MAWGGCRTEMNLQHNLGICHWAFYVWGDVLDVAWCTCWVSHNPAWVLPMSFRWSLYVALQNVARSGATRMC